jgi:chemotaxis signal transduction protein
MDDHSGTRFVICRAGDRRFALPVSAVREVCTETPVSRMPGIAAPVQGVANVRGKVVTVIQAAALLGASTDPVGVPAWLVVLRFRDGRVGLAVDEVEELAALDPTIPLLAIEAELEPLFDGAP